MKSPFGLVPRSLLCLGIPLVITLHAPLALAAANCGVFSSTLNFGNYDVLDPVPTDSTTNILILCIRNPPPGIETVSYTLSLSAGTGSFAARTMTNGPETLTYNLYANASRSSAAVWGDGSAGTVTVGGSLQPLTGQNPIRLASHTIYGRIPAQQDVAVGTYSANVILTMDY
ncbi:MAG: spore coat U domain-containing protein [Burkholderiales bacterium]|nr:spore coat U domain-containing protein [Burkholderiales bacterium]